MHVQSQEPLSFVGEAALAEINAGKVLLTGITGRKVRLTEFLMQLTGTFTTATSINLGSTDDTPVVIAALAIAGAVDGAVVTPIHANIILGAGFLAKLNPAAGVQIYKVGSAAAGGTSIKVQFTYELLTD